MVATAIVQFLWLQRLAQSQTETLKRSLEANAAQLSDAVTKDLAAMVEHFDPRPDAKWSDLLAEWNATPGIPARVQGIYRVRNLETMGN